MENTSIWCKESIPSELDEKGNKIMLTAALSEAKFTSSSLNSHLGAPSSVCKVFYKNTLKFASPGGNSNF